LREKRKKATKRHKGRRASNELLDESAVDKGGDDNAQEDEGEDKEGQTYLFNDNEALQGDGRHTADLLIVQDEKGFKMVFRGEDCVEKFGEWLLDGMHQGAIVTAHNSHSYDSFFLCEYFYNKCLLPKLILNGAKIMSMELDTTVIEFRYSLNFLPMPLKALPKTSGLTDLKKGYFPHLFNRKDTQHYVGPLPRVKDYGPDSTRTKDCQEFLAWYKELKSINYVFDFEREIEEYCCSDVNILRRCCLEFKKLMEETCQLNLLWRAYVNI